jgi:ribosomal protein S27AE
VSLATSKCPTCGTLNDHVHDAKTVNCGHCGTPFTPKHTLDPTTTAIVDLSASVDRLRAEVARLERENVRLQADLVRLLDKKYPTLKGVMLQSAGFEVPGESQRIQVLVQLVGDDTMRMVIDLYLPHDQNISHHSAAHAYSRWPLLPKEDFHG